jgi:hypothetical protein
MRLAPVVAAVILGGIYLVLPVKPKIFGDKSFTDYLIAIFCTLPGFYIAALAAVATFGREEIDYTMPHPAPTLIMETNGKNAPVELTFRMFLSFLFAYLTAMSFVAVFALVGANLIAPSAKFILCGSSLACAPLAQGIILALYVSVMGWLAFKIVITTLLGIYFMAEKIHRP